MVDEPDSNRWPTARAAALPLSFRPLAGHHSHAPACATAAPRAPDGTQAHAAGTCPSMSRIGAGVGANPFRAAATARRPCPASRAQRPRHSSGNASQRKSQRAGRPGPDAMGCRCSRADCSDLRLRTHETKRPRGSVRGRSRSSEIGATDLLEMEVSRSVAGPAVAHGRSAAQARPHRAVRARAWAWRWSDRLSSEGISCGVVARGRRRARTLRASCGECKRFFDDLRARRRTVASARSAASAGTACASRAGRLNRSHPVRAPMPASVPAFTSRAHRCTQ